MCQGGKFKKYCCKMEWWGKAGPSNQHKKKLLPYASLSSTFSKAELHKYTPNSNKQRFFHLKDKNWNILPIKKLVLLPGRDTCLPRVQIPVILIYYMGIIFTMTKILRLIWEACVTVSGHMKGVLWFEGLFICDHKTSTWTPHASLFFPRGAESLK